MTLHISLRHLHLKGHFAPCFNSRDLSALRLCYQLRVVNEKPCSFSKSAEEFQTAIVLDRCEHAHCFLHYARLDGYVGAPIGLDVLVTIRVQVGAVNDDLGPSMRVHRAIGHLEG